MKKGRSYKGVSITRDLYNILKKPNCNSIEWIFGDINKKQKEKLVKILARIMESAYRRGCQQGVNYAFHYFTECDGKDEEYRENVLKTLNEIKLGDFRYWYSLDFSPRHIAINHGRIKYGTSSIERLDAEYGDLLAVLGLYVHGDRQ